MTQYRVVFTPEASAQLTALYRHIATDTSPEIAERYTNAIVSYCESLQTLPHRGAARDGVRAGLRIMSYKKRTVIAFAVDGATVSIVGVYYGGQDYEMILPFDSSD